MDYGTPSFLFLHILFIGIFSSFFFIGLRGVIGTFLLHGLLTDFHGFGLAAIG